MIEDKRSSSVRDDDIIQYASSAAIRQLTAEHKFRSLPCLPTSSTAAGNGMYSLASGDISLDPPIRSMYSSVNEHSTISLHQQLEFPSKDLDSVVDTCTLLPQTEPKPVKNSSDYLAPLVAKKSINWQNHLSLDSAVTMTTIMQENAQSHDSEVKLEVYDNNESKFDDEPPELPPRLYSLSDFDDTETELSFDDIMEDIVEERTFENPLYQVIASCKPLGHEGENAEYSDPLCQTLASIRKGMDKGKPETNTLKNSKAIPTNMCGYAMVNQPMGDTVTLSSVPARKISEEKYGVINQLMSDDLPLASSPARDEDVYGVVNQPMSDTVTLSSVSARKISEEKYGVINQQLCDNLPLASTPAGTIYEDGYGAVNQLMNNNLKVKKFSKVVPTDFYGFAIVNQPMSDNITIHSLSAKKISEERHGVVNQLLGDELPLASSPARDEDRYGVVNQLMSDNLSVASQPAEGIDKDGCCAVNQMMSDNLSLTSPPDRKISEDVIYEVVIQPMTDSVLFSTKKVAKY